MYEGGDSIDPTRQECIDRLNSFQPDLLNLVCRISVCRPEIFSMLQDQGTDLKDGEISLCRSVLFGQLLKQRYRLWLEIGL
jgi:hypothetical protein